MVERGTHKVECSVESKAQVDVRAPDPVISSPVPSPSTPGEAGQSEGEDVLPVPGSIFNDEESAPSDPVFDDAMGDAGRSFILARPVHVHRVSVQ